MGWTYAAHGVGARRSVVYHVHAAIQRPPVQQPVGPVEARVVEQDCHCQAGPEVNPATLEHLPINTRQASLFGVEQAQTDGGEDHDSAEGVGNFRADASRGWITRLEPPPAQGCRAPEPENEVE